MARRVLVLANPISGGGKGAGLAAHLVGGLERHGLEAETRLTSRDKTGRELAGEVGPGDFESIAVVGGDGSLNDVLNGLRDLSTPVAVLPAGTANVWASEAGIPRDPAAVAALIARGHTVEAALGAAAGRRFFLFVGAGIDARLVHRVEQRRKRTGGRGGMAQWVLPGCDEFLRQPLPNLTVRVEGQVLEHLAQVLVTRVRRYAGLMRMPKGIDIRDGKLHVLAWPRRARPVYAAAFLKALCGRLAPGRNLVHLTTDGPVRIESAGPAEPCHVDGDAAGATPVEIALTGQAARLIVP